MGQEGSASMARGSLLSKFPMDRNKLKPVYERWKHGCSTTDESC